MEQVHVIRHKVMVEGQSIRRVARELGVSRNTVRKYLGQSEPRRRKLSMGLRVGGRAFSEAPGGENGLELGWLGG